MRSGNHNGPRGSAGQHSVPPRESLASINRRQVLLPGLPTMVLDTTVAPGSHAGVTAEWGHQWRNHFNSTLSANAGDFITTGIIIEPLAPATPEAIELNDDNDPVGATKATWKLKLKRYVEDCRTSDENRNRMFAALLGNCTRELHQRLREMNGWKEHDNARIQDPAWLWAQIVSAVSNIIPTSDQENEGQKRTRERQQEAVNDRYKALKQGQLSTSSYYQNMLDLLEAMPQMGITVPDHDIQANNFCKGLDTERYGLMLAEWKNAEGNGEDLWPKTLADAYQIASTRVVSDPKSKSGSRMASFPVFYTNDDNVLTKSNDIRTMIANEVKNAVHTTWPSHNDLSSKNHNPKHNFKPNKRPEQAQCINCLQYGHLVDHCQAQPQNSALAIHMNKAYNPGPSKKTQPKRQTINKIAAVADCSASGGAKEDFYG
jgi:hypothetical protein